MPTDSSDIVYRHWPHAPSHLFAPGEMYMVTGGTYQKLLHFDTPDKRDYLLSLLFELAVKWEWRLQAWAVMANHYHFVAQAPEDAKTLRRFLTSLHSKSAIWLNKLDGKPGRKVWFQFRDTCLTYEKSYLARLHYVHENPAKHHLVKVAEHYRWCSMGWFLQRAETGFRNTVLSFPIDQINEPDDF